MVCITQICLAPGVTLFLMEKSFNLYLSVSVFLSGTNYNRLMSLFRKKDLGTLLAQANDSEKGLKRTLGAGNLVALGIGAIIGAGLFVRTAAAAGGFAVGAAAAAGSSGGM